MPDARPVSDRRAVFSTTLPAVRGHARLASGGLAAEIERLRAEPAEGDIAIGGATLAAEAAALGLIDEYPGQGLPGAGRRWYSVLCPARAPVDLELVETRTFGSRVVYLRYRMARNAPNSPSVTGPARQAGEGTLHPAGSFHGHDDGTDRAASSPGRASAWAAAGSGSPRSW